MSGSNMDRVVTAANQVTLGGAATATVGWLTFTEWMAAIGAFVAVAGFIVNWWFKQRMLVLRREEIEIERRKLSQQG